MTLSRIVCAVGLVIAVVSAQNSTFDRTSESALLAANEELQKAIATRDEATIRKRLADDFTIVHNTGGAIQAREGFIRSVISGQASFAAEATYDRSTQLVGTDVALINETLN